jgi:AcrR family transcriptional regulator
MPKETFLNLPEEKRKRIFNAAAQEFSVRRFSDASVNNIIKSAGIPWGSFYQYFDNKDDLFTYVYSEILREKRALMRREDVYDPDADVFTMCVQTTKSTYEWSRLRPDYAKIALLMEVDDSELITRLRSEAMLGLIEMVERDKARGFIRQDADSALVANMLYSLILNEYFNTDMDAQTFGRKLDSTVEIIKHGVAANQKGE